MRGITIASSSAAFCYVLSSVVTVSLPSCPHPTTPGISSSAHTDTPPAIHSPPLSSDCTQARSPRVSCFQLRDCGFFRISVCSVRVSVRGSGSSWWIFRGRREGFGCVILGGGLSLGLSRGRSRRGSSRILGVGRGGVIGGILCSRSICKASRCGCSFSPVPYDHTVPSPPIHKFCRSVPPLSPSIS